MPPCSRSRELIKKSPKLVKRLKRERGGDSVGEERCDEPHGCHRQGRKDDTAPRKPSRESSHGDGRLGPGGARRECRWPAPRGVVLGIS
jgi:hypothetical protein